MWHELRQRIGKTLSINHGRKDPFGEGERPVRFVNPATVPGMPVAGEKTIRFAKPATVHEVPVAGEKTIRFSKRDLPYRQVTDVREYSFEGMEQNDIVIDIGANVGAFCIHAAMYSARVWAVEPVAWEVLEENIRLNEVPVRVIRGALGDGKAGEVEWDGFRVEVPTYTLGQIVTMAGGCDFLKCDCEGAEWQIQPEDLAGIRRIEMELHMPPIGGPPNPALLDAIGLKYDFEIERRPYHQVMGVMGILHAELRDG